VSFRLFFIYVYFRLGTNRPPQYLPCNIDNCLQKGLQSKYCKHLGERWYWQANLHSSDESEAFFASCVLLTLCNTFLYISLSASIYSKFPKTKSCLSVDISVQTCCEILFGEKKKHCNKLCFYSGFFYNGVILTPWHC
jgi:hypothetical protein